MILRSTDGTSFELTILNYQFPQFNDPLDANWLFIKGQLRGTERDWYFTEPCMETYETKSFYQWLQDVGNRSAKPVLEFTEAELSFAVLEYGDTTIKLQVEYKTYDRSIPGYTHYPVMLEMTMNDLQLAINEWQSEMQKFPVRKMS